MNKKYIALEGPYFTIEWFIDGRGKSPVYEYFLQLSQIQKEKLEQLFQIMAFTGQIRNIQKFRYEEDKIYAFKPMPDRFLCFFYQGRKIIVTNAFEKKADKLPPREKEKALITREDYFKRCKEGSYYE